MSNEDQIIKLSAKVIELKAQRDELDEAIKNYNATIGELTGPTPEGGLLVGDFKISSRENRRFDAATAKKVLPADKLEAISVTKPDATKAKALLDEVELEACKKVYGTITQVGLRDD